MIHTPIGGGWVYTQKDIETDLRDKMERFKGYARTHNMALEEVLKRVAVHEAGHAIVRLIHHVPVARAALGWVDGGDEKLAEEPVLLDIAVAGVAAEEVIFGEHTDGYYTDLRQFGADGYLSMMDTLLPVPSKPDLRQKFFARATTLQGTLEPYKEKIQELADLILKLTVVDGAPLEAYAASLSQWREENGL